jgi:hypothetical protein
MTREYDDLYARHQMLAALVNVLVHDLRNPLHSATLLVEAMGSPSANIEALRGKMRAQIGKLDGLIGETNASVKDLVVEPNVEATAVDAWLRALSDRFATIAERQATFVLPPASGLEVATDRKLLERAAIEVAAALVERQGRESETPAARVLITIDEPEAGSVRVSLGDLAREHGDALAKAPFAIAGGGIRLAMARSLAQSAGAMLRFEQDAEGTGRFAFFLRKTT